MRNGIFKRLSIVVIVISILSFIPVAYYNYSNVVPSGYIFDDYSYNKYNDLTCIPIHSYSDIELSHNFFTDDRAFNIRNYYWKDPVFFVSKSYLKNKRGYVLLYKYNNSFEEKNLSEAEWKIYRDEMDKFSSLKVELLSYIKPYEDQFLIESLEFAISSTILLPSFILFLIYVICRITKFVLYGRSKESITISEID